MAFVYEVERPPLFPINKDTSEIGPGQYLPLTLYKFEKPNMVPFGVSVKRKFPFSVNPVPGPGSYNPKQSQNISKEQELKDNKNINKNKSVNVLKKSKIKIIKKKNEESEKFQNKENLGFFTKVKRFKLKNQLGTPGPGTYDDKNILLAKSIEEKCNNKKEMIYKINYNRHDIYYVNRNNNQFPWNAEVITQKKESKIKKNDKLKKNMEIINNNKNCEIIIKNKNNQSSGKNKKINQINEQGKNKTNLSEDNINNKDKDKEKNKYKNKDSENALNKNKNSSSNIALTKSKTSSNFFIPDTGIKVYYSKLSKKEIKEKIEKEMAQRKIQNDIKYRISSIPSKFSSGYEIEKESGKIVRKPIKTYFKIFSGEKNDAVGPGSYEINLPEIWRKTGTCWSKYLCPKEPLKERPKSGNDLNLNNLINHNKLDKKYIKIAKKKIKIDKNEDKNNNINNNIPNNIFRIYSSQHMMLKDPSVHNIHSISEEFIKDKLPIFICVNDVPGPGYYYDEEKKIYNIKNNKNNFANINKYNRFEENFIKVNEDKGGLGPGTYFNDILHLFNNPNQKDTKKTLIKQKTKSAPFLCKSKRFVYDKPLDLNDLNKKIVKKPEINKDDFKKVIYNNISIESNQTSNSTHKLGSSKKEDSQNLIDREMQTKFKKVNKLKEKSKSMAGTFYRKDIRFRENYQEENLKKDLPGPGSYINPYTSTGKSNSVKIDDRYMDVRSCRLIIEKNRINKYNKNKKNEKNLLFWLGETNEIKPCVGTYEPDKTMTILYDINKNKKYGNNSFNSTQYSSRNGFYIFERGIPIGPGCYYNDKFVENKQITAAFNSTTNRFYKGGKNNTRDLYRIPKRSLSVVVKRDSVINGEGNISNELSMELKEKIEKEKKEMDLGMFNNTNTLNIVGPGTYNFLPEVYPWVKHTYNVKFV